MWTRGTRAAIGVPGVCRRQDDVGGYVAGTTAVREAGFGTALRELRTAQKSAKGVSLYSRYINRPAGRVLAAAAYRVGLTPNQVTLVSMAFTYGAIAAVALVRPSWTLSVAVYLALVIGFAFDSADGQLARLLRRGSPAGEWLDHVVDCGKITGVHAAVLISFYRFFDLPGEGWLLLPLGFQFAAVMIYVGGLLTEKLKPKSAPGSAPAAPSRIRAVGLLPVDYGVFCVVFLALGGGRAFLYAYAFLGGVYVLFLGAFLAKWFRELKAVGAPAS
ncbi:CDP-alcohol phosphatidyltransferase family protein [Streptomyces sp. So13.3]|nr:CDP-alcohol phosphatidyltransferase family protein [Streptomyces sp. So13.3]